MSEQLIFPWISLALLAPLLAALQAWWSRSGDQARRGACVALAVSVAALLAARFDAGRGTPGAVHLEPWSGLFPSGWFGMDTLNSIPLPLFAVLALGVLFVAPRRKVNPQWVSGVLLLTAATLATYAAQNLVLLGLGWSLAVAPFLSSRFFTIPGEQEIPRLSRVVLLGSVVCAVAGLALLGSLAPPATMHPYHLAEAGPGAGSGLRWALLLLMVAIFLRKGLLPVHSWIVTAFERGPLLPLSLLVNGHLGAFLAARLALPLLPLVAREYLPALGDFALLTAAYAALLALVERQPRRLLALLSVSQASFMLVGLESGNVDGLAGVLLHWQVVAVATTLLAAVYTGLEARIATELDTRRYLGLAAGAPRLSVFFLLGGLALVGLPLTLGFCAEDLLLHGTLARHPHLGVIMPAVTALNAFSVVRLWARLFLGQPGTETRGLADALPRERWVLSAALAFLLLGGLFPGPLLRLPAAAAEQLTAVLRPATSGTAVEAARPEVE